MNTRISLQPILRKVIRLFKKTPVHERLLAAPVASYGEQYYESVRNSEHVFIFGVWGRSSTTAIQRLLNSTNAISIWGEPGDYVIDGILRVIQQMDVKMTSPLAERRIAVLPEAYSSNNHKTGYAMAHTDWRPARSLFVEALSSMLRPPIGVDRFGFKEIQITSSATLQMLDELFPNSRTIFLFRDPLSQWPSVQKMDWEKCQTLNEFLNEYTRLAKLYIEHGGLFVCNDSLKSRDRMRKLTSTLNLPAVNDEMIDDGVFSNKNKPNLTMEEEEIILNSRAYASYTEMLEADRRFFTE